MSVYSLLSRVQPLQAYMTKKKCRKADTFETEWLRSSESDTKWLNTSWWWNHNIVFSHISTVYIGQSALPDQNNDIRKAMVCWGSFSIHSLPGLLCISNSRSAMPLGCPGIQLLCGVYHAGYHTNVSRDVIKCDRPSHIFTLGRSITFSWWLNLICVWVWKR